MSDTLNLLVTGGAGYIGSHAVSQLLEADHRVTVVDNLYSGHRWAVSDSAEFIEGDAGDPELMDEVASRKKFDAVFHFAGHIEVAESVQKPLKYYGNNSCVSKNLIQVCLKHKINHFIFSSTAAVYGKPETFPVTEDLPGNPINPYGRSKLVTEWMLSDAASVNSDFKYIALRYFNVAGARLDGTLGQATPNATHLIKVASQAACGIRSGVDIYGTDYNTPDGTCIRDYIHVDDLAAAHLDALLYLRSGGSSDAFNCGYGNGFSVREIIETVKKVSGADFQVSEKGRRAGDPDQLYCDPSRIKKILNWKPRFDRIDLICETAFRWEKKLNQMK
ncbi:MAG: UDP-glucose 4-epimerase GalE [Spirochaetia bacterium]|nr:UDP-glucose 4-epimerase GalE [Spirochaetia bacterium]